MCDDCCEDIWPAPPDPPVVDDTPRPLLCAADGDEIDAREPIGFRLRKVD